MNRTLVIIAVSVFVAGALAGAGAVFAATGGPEVKVLEGRVNAVNVSGYNIGLDVEDGPSGEGYVIAGSKWREAGSGLGWQDGPYTTTGAPTCLEPLTSGQRVRLGVMEGSFGDDSSSWPVVVWLECLTGPTESWAALQ